MLAFLRQFRRQPNFVCASRLPGKKALKYGRAILAGRFIFIGVASSPRLITVRGGFQGNDWVLFLLRMFRVSLIIRSTLKRCAMKAGP